MEEAVDIKMAQSKVYFVLGQYTVQNLFIETRWVQW